MASTSNQVRKLLGSLQLLRGDGSLKPLDSLGIIDLVAGLERTFGVCIPPERVSPDAFRSIDTITAFVDELRAG